MKIEKINDNQIRCTLNKHDLASREIKLSELAYGTEKAKNLFRDMMQQASFEYGFEADDHPLMIEAIPLSADSIILNISKVEDPDELDTRFSKFSPSYEESDDINDFADEYDDFADDSADEIIDYYAEDSEDNLKDSFVSLRELLSNKLSGKNNPKSGTTETSGDSEHDLLRIYRFQNLSTLERLSVVLKNVYFGSNTLYKDSVNSVYYLVVNKSGHTPEEFNRICNILTEYGIRENTSSSREAFFMEHFTLMIKETALQVLSTL
ncbi:MAG: adaptor protein MecA [Lachnospiraceae bacterium]|nr:adaptor protein MecA [Lachnospiraceae bacterium]